MNIRGSYDLPLERKLIEQMQLEAAIKLLKSQGYKVIPPKTEKDLPNGCYRIEAADGIFFMEGRGGQEEEVRAKYESAGKTVIKVEFNKDGYYFI